VWTLLGEPDGSFHLARLHPVDAANASLAVADVNGDGKPDVVLAYAGTSDAPESQVAVLPGNGAGAFGPAQAYPVGQRPYAVAVADVNGDGHPDLITADAGTSHAHGDTLSVLLNNRDGTFQPAQTVATGTYPDAVAVTDLNGDGLPDLVNANQYGHDVTVLLNGDGAVPPGQRSGAPVPFQAVTPASGLAPHDVPLQADLDADGLPDLVSLDRTGQVLFRQGLPGGQDFAPAVVLNPGRPASDVTLVSLGPGRTGLAVADRQHQQVFVYV